MKTYTGYRFGPDTSHPVAVMIHEKGKEPRRLETYRHIRCHADTFNWHYSGSGPAQLALALVADVMGDDEAVPAVYMLFKTNVVGNLPFDGWTLTEGQIRHAVHGIKTHLKKRGKQQ